MRSLHLPPAVLLRAVLLQAALLPGLAGRAEAHAILVESTPASNATAASGALALRLRYNSRIDAARSRLTLFAADGTSRVLPLDADQPPDILAAHADLPPGLWRLRWQVLALDGHITRGDVTFTLTAP